VERAVKSESSRAPDRPIYLVGESVGACVALAVAARNPGIDLVLILVNPGQHCVSLNFRVNDMTPRF
jgi:alpha-beta hydrolase superfamily lysophospholipase